MKASLKKAMFVYLVVYIVFFSLSIAYINFTTTTVVYDTSIIVGDHMGFDTNKTALKFGMIAPGGSSSLRSIVINNTESYKRDVVVYTRGDLVDWLTVDNNKFTVEPNTYKKINFVVVVPGETEFGKYSGELKIKLRQLKL